MRTWWRRRGKAKWIGVVGMLESAAVFRGGVGIVIILAIAAIAVLGLVSLLRLTARGAGPAGDLPGSTGRSVRRRWWVHALVLAITALISLALTPALAQADTTLGGLDPTPNDQNTRCDYATVFYVEAAASAQSDPASPAAGSDDIVPAGGGTITSWSTSEQGNGTKLRLAVVSFSGGATKVTVDALSPIETIPGNADGAVVSFPVDIPVTAGEQIALDVYSPAPYRGCAFAGPASQQIDVADDGQDNPQAQGQFGQNADIPGYQVNLAAVLQAPTSTPTTSGSTPAPTPAPSAAPPASTPAAHNPGDVGTVIGSQAAVIRRLNHISMSHLNTARRTQIPRLIGALKTAMRELSLAVGFADHATCSTTAQRLGERTWTRGVRRVAVALSEFLATLRDRADGHDSRAERHFRDAQKAMNDGRALIETGDRLLGVPRTD